LMGHCKQTLILYKIFTVDALNPLGKSWRYTVLCGGRGSNHARDMLFPFFWFSASFHLCQIVFDHLRMLAVMMFQVPWTRAFPRVEVSIDTVCFATSRLRRDDIFMWLFTERNPMQGHGSSSPTSS